MTKRHKVLIVGPVGAGKTAAVRALADEHALVTDVRATDVAALRKGTTTVAMDFCVVPLGEGEVAHVYGAPGQERFDFMWDILTSGVGGILLLLDNSRNFPRQDLQTFLAAFDRQIAATRFVVGVTHADLSCGPPLEAYARWLGESGTNAEVACVDPRCKDDMMFLLRRLLEQEPGHAAQPIDRDAGEAAGDAGQIDSRLDFDFPVFEAAGRLRGVTGVSLIDDIGEAVHSTIDETSCNDLFAYLYGMTPKLEERAGRGRIRRITLRSQQEESLSIFVGKRSALGLRSECGVSVAPHLGDQIVELAQWIKH